MRQETTELASTILNLFEFSGGICYNTFCVSLGIPNEKSINLSKKIYDIYDG